MKSSSSHSKLQHEQNQKHQKIFKNKNNKCFLSLAYSIGSFSIACGSLLQMNSTSERITLQKGFFLTTMGFIYFISLTDFFNRFLLEAESFRKKYHLMVSDIMDITNKIVSAIQATLSCVAGFIVCKSSCSKSFLYASHFAMEAYAWFGTAYFMYDIWAMYKVHSQKIADKLKSSLNLSINPLSKSLPPTTMKVIYNQDNSSIMSNTRNENKETTKNESNDCVKIMPDISKTCGRWGFFKYIITHPLMVMHHIFIGTFGLLVVTYLRGGFGDCVYSFIYMMEFSTPFVSLRGILSTLGCKASRLYVVNGLTMLGTFFMCRILMWPYVLHWYSIAINRPFIEAIMGLPRACKISILILFLPQVYWFGLMVKGAIKVLLPSKQIKNVDNNIVQSNEIDKELQNNAQTGEFQRRPTNLSQHLSLPVHIDKSNIQGKSPNQSRTLL